MGKEAREVVVHALIRLFGSAGALAGLGAEQLFGRCEESPSEAVFTAVFVGRIYKVFRNDICCHLQAADIGVELAAHLRSGKAACRPELTRYETAAFTQGAQYGIFYASLGWQRIFASAPVAQIGPPVATDKACFARKELSIDAVAGSDNGTLPFPQGPLPCAIGKLSETAHFGHEAFGTVAWYAAVEQRQEAYLLDVFYQFGTGVEHGSEE